MPPSEQFTKELSQNPMSPAPSMLEDILFPSEAELAEAIKEQHSNCRHLEERVYIAIKTAVDQWLSDQNVDPDTLPGL